MKTTARTVGSIAVAAALLTACGSSPRTAVSAAADTSGTGSTATSLHTISTRGVGTASGEPDTLTVVIGVSTQDASAKAALDANNSKAAALIALLRAKGVAARDIQTSQLSINPSYSDKANTITGYQVDNTVQATLHSVGSAGTLLDAAAGAVGNAVRISGVGFSMSDDNPVRAQARAQAVTRAQAQAAQIAKAAGAKLGALRSVSEVPEGSPPVNYDARVAAGSTAASSVPVQAGQQDVSVSVDVVYDLA